MTMIQTATPTIVEVNFALMQHALILTSSIYIKINLNYRTRNNQTAVKQSIHLGENIGCRWIRCCSQLPSLKTNMLSDEISSGCLSLALWCHSSYSGLAECSANQNSQLLHCTHYKTHQWGSDWV